MDLICRNQLQVMRENLQIIIKIIGMNLLCVFYIFFRGPSNGYTGYTCQCMIFTILASARILTRLYGTHSCQMMREPYLRQTKMHAHLREMHIIFMFSCLCSCLSLFYHIHANEQGRGDLFKLYLHYYTLTLLQCAIIDTHSSQLSLSPRCCAYHIFFTSLIALLRLTSL